MESDYSYNTAVCAYGPHRDLQGEKGSQKGNVFALCASGSAGKYCSETTNLLICRDVKPCARFYADNANIFTAVLHDQNQQKEIPSLHVHTN